VTPGEQAGIRAYLEQTDPWLDEYTRTRTEHDIRVAWELLLALEAAQEQIRNAGRILAAVLWSVGGYACVPDELLNRDDIVIEREADVARLVTHWRAAAAQNGRAR
jgi:hypothetical protein